MCVVTVTVHYARKMRWSSGQCNKRKNGQGKDPRTNLTRKQTGRDQEHVTKNTRGWSPRAWAISEPTKGQWQDEIKRRE